MGTPSDTSRYYALLVGAIMTFVQLSDAQPTVGIWPTEGSTAGGTEITITFDETKPVEFDDFVIAMSDGFQCIQCDVRYGLSSFKQLVITTRPMRPGEYTFSLTGPVVQQDVYCDPNNLCKFTAKADRTPLVEAVLFSSRFVKIGPLATVTFNFSMMSKGEQFRWPVVGGRTCVIYNQARSSQLGVLFDQTGDSGTVQCEPTVREAGIYDIGFSVIGPYGSSRPLQQFASANRKIGHVEVIDMVTQIIPNSGSKSGGTFIIIHGPTWPEQLSQGVSVTIGDKDVSSSCHKTTDPNNTLEAIVCTTPPEDPSMTVFYGSNGVKLEVFNDGAVTTISDLKSTTSTPTSTETRMSSHWDDLGRTFKNFAVKMSFCFKPPVWLSGDCSFVVSSDLNVDLVVNGVSESCLATASPCTLTVMTLNGGNSYCMTAYSIGGGTNSYVTIGLECSGDDLSSGDLPGVRDEVQRIRVTRTYDDESYIIDKSTNTATAGQSTIQTVTVPNGSTYTITYTMGTSTATTTDLSAASDAPTIQKALETAMLQVWVGRPLPFPIVKVTIVKEANGDSALTFTFNSVLGEVELLTVGTFTVTSTAGRISTEKVYFTLGNSLSAPVDLTNLDITKLKTSLLPLLAFSCPSLEILPSPEAASSTTYFITGFEGSPAVLEKAHMGKVRRFGTGPGEPFCGLQYISDPVYLYRDMGASYPDTKNLLSRDMLKICFAYIKSGDGAAKVKAQFLWKGVLLQSRDGEIVLETLTTNDVTWTYICADIHTPIKAHILQLLTGTNAPDIEPMAFYLTAVVLDSPGSTVQIDQVYIGWGPDPSATSNPRYPPAKVKSSPTDVNGKTVSEIIVTEDSTNIFKVVLKSADCDNYNIFDELKIAGTVSSPTPAPGSATLGVTLTRTSATTPSTGTFTVSGQTVSLNAPAEEIWRAVEMTEPPCSVKVARTGDCATRDYDVTFLKPNPIRTLITSDAQAVVTRVDKHAHTFDVIPFSMIRSRETKPQVMVSINGIPSMCQSDCSFTYDAAKTPVINTVTPAVVTASCATATTLTFTGTSLTTDRTTALLFMQGPAGTDVILKNCDITTKTDTSLQCDVTLCIPQAVYDVTVELVGESVSTVQLTVKVELIDTDINPTSGRASGGSLLTITGHKFAPTDTFSVGGSSCGIIRELSDPNSVVCRTTQHALGAVKVTVTSNSISPTANTGAAYEYIADTPGSPVVTAVTPNTATVDGSSRVNITGTDLGLTEADWVVKVGVRDARILRWVMLKTGDIQLTVLTPPNPVGDHTLRLVKKSDGMDAFIETGLNVMITYSLTVTYVTPPMGALSGGTMVSVYGSGFPDNCRKVRVTVSPSECEPASCSPQLIKCRLGKRPPTTHFVTNTGCHLDLGPGYGWSESSLSVQPHDKVTFSWALPSCTPHQIQILKMEGFSGAEVNPPLDPSQTAKQQGTYTLTLTELGTFYYCSSEIQGSRGPVRMCIVITVAEGAMEKVNLRVFVNDVEATYSFQALPPTVQPEICSCPDLPEPEPSSGEEMIDYPGYIKQTKAQKYTPTPVTTTFTLPTVTPTACSATISATEVTYPISSAAAYTGSTDCEFTVTGTGQMLYVRFKTFHMENSAQCQADFVQLYDGETCTGTPVARLCGYAHPYQVQLAFPSGKMCGFFHSDALVEAPGFSMELSASPLCSVTDAFTPGSGFLVSPGLIQAFTNGDFLPDDLRQTGDEINLNDNFWDVAESTDPYDLELSRDFPIEYSDMDIATEGHYSKAQQFLSLLGAKNWYSEESQSPAIPSYRQLSQLDRLKHELVSGYIKGKRFNFLTPDGAPITPIVPSTGCQWRIKPDTPVTLHVYHLNFGDIEDCTNNKLKVADTSDTSTSLFDLCGNERKVQPTTLGDMTLILEYTGTLNHMDYLIFYTTGTAMTSLPFPTVSAASITCDATAATSATCGDCSADDDGTISSLTMLPSGGKYTVSKDCAWTIPLSSGKVTWLLFTVLDLGPDDYIEIHKGADATTPLIGRFTGQSPNGLLHIPTALGADVYLRFHSDANTDRDGAGFQVHWNYGGPVFDVTVETTTTFISSPEILDYGLDITDATYIPESTFFSITTYNLFDSLTAITQADPTYPWVPPVGQSHLYPRENAVSWIINGVTDHTISCRIVILEMFAEKDCATNQLELFSSSDGSTFAAFGSPYCTSLQDGEWKNLATQYAKVTVTSTNNHILRYLVYCDQVKTTANCAITTPDSAVINTITMGPGPSPLACVTWTVTAPTGHLVLFMFEATTENKKDCDAAEVKVYEGTNTFASPLATYSPSSIPSPVQTTTDTATVTLTATGTFVPAMFLRYLAVPQALTSTLSDPKGVITSPGWVLGWYPAHAASTDYVYTVTSGDNGLSLFIADLDVSCTNADFILKVADSNSVPLLTSQCGAPPGDVYSVPTGTDLVVTLTLGPAPGVGRGFMAVYYAHTIGCGGEMSNSDSVTSPSSGKPICVYIMKITGNKRAKVDVTAIGMAAEDPWAGCKDHYIEVYYDTPRYDPDIGTLTGAVGRYCGTSPPPPMISTGQFLMLVYVSPDNSGTFAATFTEDICEVQALDERTGMMVAPGFPSYTASVTGTDCTMTVTAATQSDIILWYQVDMEVGAQVELKKDNTAYTDLTLDSTMGPDIHIISAVTTLEFVFVSGSNPNSKAGFIIYYIIVDNTAATSKTSQADALVGASATGTTAIAIQPTTNTDEGILVTWSQFDITAGDYRDICTDWVRLYDCLNPADYKEWCGSTVPAPSLSVGRCVVLVSHITTVSGAGFNAEYKVVASPVQCTSGPWVTAPSGEVTSPGYPLGYPTGLTGCAFIIDVHKIAFNTLIFITYDLGIGEQLMIKEGLKDSGAEVVYTTTITPLMVKPGETSVYKEVDPILTNKRLHIKLTSDAMHQGMGFKITYHAVNSDACGALETSGGDEGCIQSPYYPSLYPPNTMCAWKIPSVPGAPADTFLQMTFYSLQLEGGDGCPYDRIQLFNLNNGPTDPDDDQHGFVWSQYGHKHLAFDGRLCGIHDLTEVMTTSPEVMVVFVSDNSNSYSGFSACYQRLPKGTCSLAVGDTPLSGAVYSPNYPLPYPADAACITILTAPVGDTILITFKVFSMDNFDDTCDTDSLTISNPSTTYQIKDHQFDKWVSSGNTATILFQSNGAVQGPGYVLMYAYIPSTTPLGANDRCSKTLVIPSTLPNSGLPVPLEAWMGDGSSYVCEFTVEPGPFSVLLVIYYTLRASPDGSCSFNRLMVRPGGVHDLSHMQVVCGKDLIVVQTSPGDAPWIKVIAFSASEEEKVSIYAWRVDDCGGLLKSPTGFLSSPTTSSLAPNTNYPNDKVCFWVLEAPTVKSMELAFNEFDLGACAPNAKDWLEVSTGLTDMLDQYKPPKVTHHCGNKIPQAVYADTQWMFVTFVSDATETSTGFSASFKMKNTQKDFPDAFLQCSGSSPTCPTPAPPPTSPQYQPVVSFSDCSTPTVTATTPRTGPAGTVLTITGTGFSRSSCFNQVFVGEMTNAAPCHVTMSSDTELRCTLEDGNALTPGTALPLSVHVHNRGVARIDIANPADSKFTPTVSMTSVSPTAGSQYGGTLVTVFGMGVGATGTTVKLDTTDCPVISRRQEVVVCRTVTVDVAVTGTVQVYVTVNGADVSCPDCHFDYSQEFTPMLSSTEHMLITREATEFFLPGKKLSDDCLVLHISVTKGTDVYWCKPRVCSQRLVMCDILGLPAVTNYEVRLWKFPYGYSNKLTAVDGSAQTNGNTPTVTSMTSSNPTECTPSMTLTLAGTQFETTITDNMVEVGDVPCDVTATTGTTSLTCDVMKRLPAGSYDVMLWTTSGGKATSSVVLTCTLSATLAPTDGGLLGGILLTLSGHGFSYESTVTVCGQPCPLMFSQMPDVSSSLVCELPPHTDTAATADVPCDVTMDVDGSGTTTETQTSAFTYKPSKTPRVASITPVSGSAGGGDIITVSGENLGGVNVVNFGCAECDRASITVTDGTTLKCKTVPTLEAPYDPNDPVQPATTTPCVLSNDKEHPAAVKVTAFSTSGTVEVASAVTFSCINTWSSPMTWHDRKVPQANDIIVIEAGLNVVLDTATHPLYAIVVYGALIFERKSGVHLRAGTIYVRGCGVLQIGTDAAPYTETTAITLEAPGKLPHFSHLGTLVVEGGSLNIFGKPIMKTWTHLDTTAQAGSKTLTLVEAVEWAARDTIIITPTGMGRSERRVIESVSANKMEITLTEALVTTHLGDAEDICGETNTPPKLQLRAEVGLLSRNIRIQGRPGNSDTGAAILVRSAMIGATPPKVHIQGVEITMAGQPRAQGSAAIQFVGVGDMAGSYVKGSAIHRSFNKGIVLCHIQGFLIDNNVVHDTTGSGISLQCNTETGNKIKNNLISESHKTLSLSPQDDLLGAVYITNPNNIVKDNAISGSQGHGIWYDLSSRPTDVAGTTCPNSMPIGEAMGNVVHSCADMGLRIENYQPKANGNCQGAEEEAIFGGITSYANSIGVSVIKCGKLKLMNFILVANVNSGLVTHGLVSMDNVRITIADAIIVGKSTNLQPASDVTCTAEGIILPLLPGFVIDGLKVANFIQSCYPLSLSTATNGTVNYGGWPYVMKRTMKCSGDNLVNFRVPFGGVIIDQDGSLTNKGKTTAILPNTEVYKEVKDANDVAACAVENGLTICDGTVKFARVEFYNALVWNQEQGDFTVVIGQGKTTAKKELKANMKPNSTMALLPLGQKICIELSTQAPPSNFSYNMDMIFLELDYSAGVLSNPTSTKDYIVFCHTVVEPPDLMYTLPSYGGLNITADPTPTDDLGNFFYSNATKEFTYLAKRVATQNKAGFDVAVAVLPTPPPQLPNISALAQELPPPATTDSTITIEEGAVKTMNASVEGKCLVILGYLVIEAKSTTPIELKFECIYVGPVGAFLAGDATDPLTRDLTVTLKYAATNCACTQNVQGKQYFAVHGLALLYGKEKTTFTRLAAPAPLGTTALTLEVPPTGWTAGDQLVLTASSSKDPGESEVVTVQSVTGNQVTLDAGTTYAHQREVFETGSSSWTLNTGVGMLTHNIRIRADPTSSVSEARFYVSNFGQAYQGYMKISQVEFRGLGHGVTSQQAVLLTGLGNQVDWFFFQNSIVDSLFTALEVAGTNVLPIQNNVIYSAVNSGINLIDTQAVKLEGNLVAGVAVADSLPANWGACIDARLASQTLLKNNFVSGCRQIGLAIPLTGCGNSDTARIDMANNEVSTSTVGVYAVHEGTDSACVQLKSLTVHKSFHFGIFIKALVDVELADVYVADNTVSISIVAQGPQTTAAGHTPRAITISRALIQGTSDTYDCTNNYEVTTAVESVPPINLNAVCHVGIMWPEVVEGLNTTMTGRSWTDRTTSASTNALLQVKDSVFFNFATKCSPTKACRDFMVTANKKSTDILYPFLLTQNVTISPSVDDDSRAFFDYPDPSLATPEKCGYLCDALMNLIVKLPLGVTLIPDYSALWQPSTANATTVKLGDALVSEVARKSGFDSTGLDPNRICTAAVAAQGKVCQGEDFEMFRIENMDPGSLYRYIGPVSSLSKKTIDLINGPAVINTAPALGTCTNGSCVARPPFFYQAVVIGEEYFLVFKKLTPNRLQLTLLNTPGDKCIKTTFYYPGRNRQDVFSQGALDNRLVAAFEKQPVVGDPVGSNYYNRDTLLEYIIVCGGAIITVKLVPVVEVALKVVRDPTKTLEQMLEDFRIGLANAMSVDVSFVKVSAVTTPASQRRKRATEESLEFKASVAPEPTQVDNPEADAANEETMSAGTANLVNSVQSNTADLGVVTAEPISIVPAPPPVGSPAYDELEKVAEAEADGTSTVSILEASMITLSVPGGLVFKENITTAQEGAVFPSVPTLHTTDVAGKVIPQLGTLEDPWRLSVTLTSSSAGVAVGGPTTIAFHKGVAKFDGFRINKEGSNIVLFFFISHPAGLEKLNVTFGPFDVLVRQVEAILEIKTNHIISNNQTTVYIIIRDPITKQLIPDLSWKGQTWRWTLSMSNSTHYTGTMRYTDKHETIPVGNTGRAVLVFNRPGRVYFTAHVYTEPKLHTTSYNLNIQSDYIDILSPVAANESAVTVSQSVTLTTAEALTDSPSSNAAGTRRRRRALTSSGNMSDLKAEIINALAWRFPNAYFTDVIFYENSVVLKMRGDQETLQRYSVEIISLVTSNQLPITVGGTPVTVRQVTVGQVTGTVAATSAPKTTNLLLVAILVPIIVILVIVIIIVVVVLLLKSNPKSGSTVHINADTRQGPRQGSAISNRSQAQGSREAFVDQEEAMARETSEMFRARTTPEPSAADQPPTDQPPTGQPPTEQPTTSQEPTPAEIANEMKSTPAAEPPPAAAAAPVSSRPPTGSAPKPDRVRSPAPKAPTEEGRVSVSGSRPASSVSRPASSATTRLGEGAPSPMPDANM